MNKASLVDKISTKYNFNKETTKLIVDSFFDEITKLLINDESVMISGFGTFERSRHKTRYRVNPKTGQKVLVKAKHSVSFKASSNLKEKIEV